MQTGPSVTSGNSIYLVHADGSGLHRLLPGGAGGDPAWSPDGSKIAFVYQYGAIGVMNADGSGLSIISRNPPGESSPTWSPDGRRIAFAMQSVYPGPGPRIYVMDADGSHVQALTPSGMGYQGPVWSPRGDLIAMIRHNGEDSTTLFVMRPDGSRIRKLVQMPGLWDPPTWSPDGAWLAFGTGAIWAVRPDGTGLHRLTASGLFPAWSPDGRLIAFTGYEPACAPTVPSQRCGARVEHLYVMNSDGSDVRVLAVDVRGAGSLAWQPRPPMAAPPGTPLTSLTLPRGPTCARAPPAASVITINLMDVAVVSGC